MSHLIFEGFFAGMKNYLPSNRKLEYHYQLRVPVNTPALHFQINLGRETNLIIAKVKSARFLYN